MGCQPAYGGRWTTSAEVAEEHRDLQLARLEEAIRGCSCRGCGRVTFAAIDRLVKVIDRIARLAGLDKLPPQLSVSADTTADGPESVRAVTALLATYPHRALCHLSAPAPPPAARVVDG